jgi:hypothetical protein
MSQKYSHTCEAIQNSVNEFLVRELKETSKIPSDFVLVNPSDGSKEPLKCQNTQTKEGDKIDPSGNLGSDDVLERIKYKVELYAKDAIDLMTESRAYALIAEIYEKADAPTRKQLEKILNLPKDCY